MDEMGGPGRGYIAEVLEEVSCSEYQRGCPLLTALVVHSFDRLPGYGFWYIRDLPESIKNASDYQKIKFWEEECRRVWQYWAKHGP
jgi:serine/threonine protein kinase HipA of HipAB toxin-antitoxin module